MQQSIAPIKSFLHDLYLISKFSHMIIMTLYLIAGPMQ